MKFFCINIFNLTIVKPNQKFALDQPHLTTILNFVSALKKGFPRLLQVNRLPADFFHKNKDTTNLMLSILIVISTLRAKNFEYSKTCLKRSLKKETKNWFSRPIIA